MRTNSAYKVFGVEPVASPITHLRPSAVFSFIRSAMILATYFDPSLGEGKIFTGIFSKESIILVTTVAGLFELLIYIFLFTKIKYFFPVKILQAFVIDLPYYSWRPRNGNVELMQVTFF